MKILVVGGAGFIGSHLVDKLVERGHDVIVLDDLSAGKLSNLDAVKDQISFKQGSVCDLELMRLLTKDVDVIYHLATQCLVKGLGNPYLMHQVNDIGTFNVCLTAKENNCKIIYIGTSEEYGPQETFPIKETALLNPVSIYGITKVVGELYVRFFNKIYDVPAVIIRPFNTFGPRQREDAYAGVITSFVKRLTNNLAPIIFGDGLQTRDFTYVSDIVEGIVLLSKLENGEVVNLGSETETSVLDIATALNHILRENMPISPVFDAPRINDVRQLRADITIAKNYGYKPKVKFEVGLKIYVKWYTSSRNRR